MRELANGIHQFWFGPTTTSTVALLRIVYGVLLFGWTATLAPDTLAFFSETGTAPVGPGYDYWWDPISFVGHDLFAVAVVASLLVAAVCVVVGYHTQVALFTCFVLQLFLRNRNPSFGGSDQSLVRAYALFLAVSPAGAALSVDRWRKNKAHFWRFPARAPWGLRLLQVQICMVYLFTVWAKTRGDFWWDGTASGYVLHVDDLARFAPPAFIRDSLFVVNLMTWGTLLVEISLAFLLWNRRSRRYVIAAGLLLHLSIELTMQLGWFSAIMVVGYLAFVPEETAEAVLDRVRVRLRRSRFKALRTIADPEPPARPIAPAEPPPRVPVGAGSRR